jgi:hypothetical protein
VGSVMDVFGIQAHQGAGAHWLLSLTYHIYTQSNQIIEFNGHGNSHLDACKYLGLTTEFEVRDTYPRHQWPYKIKLLNTSNGDPLLIFHESGGIDPIDTDRMISIHPNIKFLYVNIYPEDFTLLEANHLLKQTRHADPSKIYVTSYMDLYKTLVDTNPIFRKDIKNVADFNSDELEVLIKAKTALSQKYMEFLMTKFRAPTSIADRVFHIDYMDIITNKEKTLCIIEEMTGKTRTKASSDSYDIYLENHYDLYRKDAAWLLPK